MLRRLSTLSLAFIMVASSVATSLTAVVSPASAVSGAEWRAGRIIDDGVFTNPSDMSVGEIQAFLNARVPVCDTWGTQTSEFGGGTRAQYGASRGNPAPFTCLKDYYEVPKTAPGPGEPASNYGGAAIPPGAQSSAQIISNAAQKYSINPKALLVKLATESPGPLTSDDWPFKRQYLYAMGAHCPDSGPGGAANCDANWASFSLQMDEAAALLRWYLDSMTQPWWQYKKPYQVNSILWNVAPSGCGAGDVYIETKATAALYTYTPYQPNQAALNNLYGTGDGCSAYGNRNFWRVWYDWFGSPQSPSYAWQPIAQYAYTDSSKTTGIGLGSLQPGQRAYVGMTIRNTGSTTWTNGGANPVNLGTTRAHDRASQFVDNTWLGPSRPARLIEASVPPGSIGTFEFWIKAPESYQGSFKEYFAPLAEGKAWMPDMGLYFDMFVQPPKYTWDLAGQYAFTDETKSVGTGLNNLQPGQRVFVGMSVKNTGNMTWRNTGTNPTRIGTTHALDRQSIFYDPSWLSPSRPSTMKESSVAPGQTATFEFWLRAPYVPTGGNYKEYFNPLVEGKAWLNDLGLNFATSVIKPDFSWTITGQYAYSDSSKATPIGLEALTPGQTVFVGFTAKNNGNITWRNSGTNPVRLGSANPIDSTSPFCEAGTWLNCSRPTTMKESSVAPGQTATFEFALKAPAQNGQYRAYFNPLSEGLAWMPYTGLSYYIVVR